MHPVCPTVQLPSVPLTLGTDAAGRRDAIDAWRTPIAGGSSDARTSAGASAWRSGSGGIGGGRRSRRLGDLPAKLLAAFGGGGRGRGAVGLHAGSGTPSPSGSGRAETPSNDDQARDRIGGRCWSAREWQGGQVCEHGGEFIDTRHVHIRDLADELGLQLDDLFATWGDDWDWFTWVDGARAEPIEILAPMNEAAKEIARIAKANGSFLAPSATPEAVAFDQMSEAEWITEATGESMDSTMGRLITQRQAGWYGLDPDQLGATNLLDFYASDWLGADERYTTHGGNDQIPRGLLDALPEGSVTLEAALESITRTGAGTYEARFAGVKAPVVADHLSSPFRSTC